MAGYVIYFTIIARPRTPLMPLVGVMAAFGLLAIMLLEVVLFARHPLIEKIRQKEARASERCYQAFFDHAPVGLGLTTENGRFLAHNEALSIMLGCRGKDLPGFDARSIYRDPDDRARLLKLLKRDGFIENFESELRRRDGTTFVANLTARWLYFDGEEVLFSVFQDITDRKLSERSLAQAKREMEILASRDGLTGIANRRLFDEQLEIEWKRGLREDLPLSLIIADIDFFKAYNDTNGHLAGDDCLKKVAKVLRGCLRRPTDLLARYGGEEFAAILPNTGIEGAFRLAVSMKARVKALAIAHPNSKVAEHVTVSLGVASMQPKRDSSHSELIEAADRALYEAKREGRDRIRISSVALGGDKNLSARPHVA
jgi:diguanylate cyclase (GGDEF)-like protein/PAS domain S-box-containing protein